MSAELLREAAALMRERADSATTGPWKFPHRGFPGVVTSRAGNLWSSSGKGRCGQINHEPDAEHIASWHPAVALAVADLLDQFARAAIGTTSYGDLPFEDNVADIARAYLGRES